MAVRSAIETWTPSGGDVSGGPEHRVLLVESKKGIIEPSILDQPRLDFAKSFARRLGLW